MWFNWGGATHATIPVPRAEFVADWIPAETPKVTRDYCPQCEPTVDPTAECVTVVWCGEHSPPMQGKDDDQLWALLEGVGRHYQFNEAGGADNKAVCDFIHRPHTTSSTGRHRRSCEK